MAMDLVTRIATTLARPTHAAQRHVLEAIGRGGEVSRWPSPGGYAPPAQDVWEIDPGSYRRVDRSVQVLAREELVQLLDAPSGGHRRPWEPTPLGRAVLAALAARDGQRGGAS